MQNVLLGAVVPVHPASGDRVQHRGSRRKIKGNVVGKGSALCRLDGRPRPLFLEVAVSDANGITAYVSTSAVAAQLPAVHDRGKVLDVRDVVDSDFPLNPGLRPAWRMRRAQQNLDASLARSPESKLWVVEARRCRIRRSHDRQRRGEAMIPTDAGDQLYAPAGPLRSSRQPEK